MTPSEVSLDGLARGVADENDSEIAHARSCHEGSYAGNIVSSYGAGHSVKQERRQRIRRCRYDVQHKFSSLGEEQVDTVAVRGDYCGEQAVVRGVYQAAGRRKRVAGSSFMGERREEHGFKSAARTAGKRKAGGLYAALDLGTNNCRLLIAKPTRPGHFRVIDAFSRIVRLGEGIGHTKRLSEEAMERAIEALRICRARLTHADITHQWLIATEACRLADNGADFIDRVQSEVGLQLEIVDRETEARLAVSGCGTLVEQETEAIVLFDIGGGSSEIALIDISKRRSPRLAEHIIAWTSLPVGVVTLAERFGGEVVTEESFLQMKNHVAGLLDTFADRNKLDHFANSPNFHLLGTSGTVTTLAGIHLNLDRYDRRRVDGMWLDSCDVTRVTNVLLSWDMQQRLANPCISAGRADLVLAGCAILEAICSIWPGSRLRVADRGLREGILTELMSRTGAWRRRRSFSLQRICENSGKAPAR